MTTCGSCGKDLPRSVDEFGPIRNPICISCFLNSKEDVIGVATEIANLEVSIRDGEDDLRRIEREIEELEGEKDDMEHYVRRDKMRIEELRKHGKNTIRTEKQKLAAWASGDPFHDQSATANIFAVVAALTKDVEVIPSLKRAMESKP